MRIHVTVNSYLYKQLSSKQKSNNLGSLTTSLQIDYLRTISEIK